MSKYKFRSGFAVLVGRPNTGKSTLLNSLLGEKISIVSPVPQTTRFRLRGILNQNNFQLVFVDTPGIHLFKDKFSLGLNKISLASWEGIDLLLYVVDVSRVPGREERKIIDIVARQKTKVLMILNKIDLKNKFLNLYIEFWRQTIEKNNSGDPLVYYIPVSAKEGTNMEELKSVLFKMTPEGMPLYDKGSLTDFPLKLRVADIIREKIFLRVKEEVPHAVAVVVKEIQEKQASVYISAFIYTQRDSQKKIIIGKNGQLLKEAGKDARCDIEAIYKKKTYLDLWVKTQPDWQKNPEILADLGYLAS